MPELSWFSPFAVPDGGSLVAGLLIAIFIYWGWEASVSVTEETENGSSASGRAAVASTIVLLLTYLSVAVAVVSFAGAGTITQFADDDAILSTVATDVLGSPLDKVVVLAVLTSALASSQTTFLPSSRVMLSMARSGALPGVFGRVHPRFLTPHVSACVIWVLAVAWYVPLNVYSENFLFDTLSALSMMVAFYYALTGFACVVYYRRLLLKNAKNLLLIGLAPFVGASMLTYLLFRSLVVLADPSESYTGAAILGLGLPLVIGVGFLSLGAILMAAWRFSGRGKRFFDRRPETVAPEIAGGARATEPVDAPAKGR